jgi:hypothetical protein
MKKVFFAALCAGCVLSLAAQSGGSGAALLNVGEYSKLFLNAHGRIAPKYYRAANEDDYSRISAFGGEYLDSVDTPLEIALLSTCAGVIDVRPPEADAVLPKNNPRLADTKLGAAVYMDMQAAKFLGSDPAPYAAALKFITDRGRVTQANIIDFMKQGIAAAVDAEFNKITFMININSSMSYNCILTHSTNNQYVLSYESYFGTSTKSKKEITGISLETLVAALSKSGDFNQTAINTVRNYAALIPAVVLAESGTTEAIIGTTKNILTAFYINPTTATYNNIKALSRTYAVNRDRFYYDSFFSELNGAFVETLASLNQEIASNVFASYATTTTISREVTAGLDTLADVRKSGERRGDTFLQATGQ